MKGKLVLAALLLVACVLAGCSSSQVKNTARAATAAHAATKIAQDQKQQADSNSSSATSATDQQKQDAVNQEAKAGIKFVVTKLTDVTAQTNFANAGTRYVAATLDIVNNTKQAMSISTMGFRALDQNKQAYQIDASTYGASNALKDGYVNPGQEVTGDVIFAMPTSATQIFVQYSDNPYDDNSFASVPFIGQNAVQQK